MTCIVGLIHEGKVFIGGDSAGVAGLGLCVRADGKVFVNSGFVFGFTTSFRMGQLLRHAFTPPYRRPDVSIDKYMVTEFVDALRTCLKSGGYARKDNDVEAGGTFLVGHAGRLFKIEGDYQVGESSAGYMACGCGDDIALGALFASGALAPEDRITLALRAAEANSAGVRGPFKIESI